MKLRPIGIEMKTFEELLKEAFEKSMSNDAVEYEDKHFVVTANILQGMYNEIRDKLLDIEQHL